MCTPDLARANWLPPPRTLKRPDEARPFGAAEPARRLKKDLLPSPKIGFASLRHFAPATCRWTERLAEIDMSGLGGLNKSPEGVVIGLVQLQLPVVVTKADLARQTDRIVYMVGKARRNLGTMDIVVFPEYSLHGLSMDTNPAIMCRLDGPEVAAFKKACIDNKIWGCFSIMEFNPDGNPYNSGLIIDDHGEIKLYYRKFHPWIPVEPWEPGNIGIPVIEGPKGARIALIICHDGMFPEMARECAYKGAEIMIRTAGYTAPIRESWRFTNQANAFQNLMITANVCMCGSDGSFDSMGEGMIVNFDGGIIVHGTTGRPDEIITAEVRPDLVREARIHWGVENNIYQLWHRGYVAVKGGAMDCPYTFMQDMVAGTFRLPWEDQVKVTDGTSCGFPAPTRIFGPATDKAAE
jgi:formamidase